MNIQKRPVAMSKPLSKLLSGINPRTARNYEATIKHVNRYLKIPEDIFNFKMINERFPNDLFEWIATGGKGIWKITKLSQLKQKIAQINALMNRFGRGKDHNVNYYYHQLEKMVDYHEIELEEGVPENIPDWHDLQDQLSDQAGLRSTKGIICLIYAHGYVLRTAELFLTRLVDDGIHNFLDLEKGIWSIRKHKRQHEGDRIFEISPLLKNRLKVLKTDWLLTKKNGEPYSDNCYHLTAHGWNDLPPCRIIRHSFETWNRLHSGYTEEQKTYWHTVLGHTSLTAMAHYVDPVKTNT